MNCLGRLRFVVTLLASFNFQVVKLLSEIMLKELHDRIIVATAKLLNAKLITKDKEIRESRIVEVVW